MNYLHRLAGIIIAFCLMIILFITSVEAIAYWSPGYFEKEYTKHHVLESLPSMTMEDLLEVTGQMMDYLKGNREDLHILTTIHGQEAEFFNQREIAHMEDVQQLFLNAIYLRRICLGLSAVLLVFMILTGARMRRILWSSLSLGTGLFFGIITALALLISTNFTKYFIMFHHIFFTNDLWILDPSTDRLINIVPEGFFMDTAGRIALLFGSLSLLLFGIFLFLTVKNRGKEER